MSKNIKNIKKKKLIPKKKTRKQAKLIVGNKNIVINNKLVNSTPRVRTRKNVKQKEDTNMSKMLPLLMNAMSRGGSQPSVIVNNPSNPYYQPPPRVEPPQPHRGVAPALPFNENDIANAFIKAIQKTQEENKKSNIRSRVPSREQTSEDESDDEEVNNNFKPRVESPPQHRGLTPDPNASSASSSLSIPQYGGFIPNASSSLTEDSLFSDFRGMSTLDILKGQHQEDATNTSTRPAAAQAPAAAKQEEVEEVPGEIETPSNDPPGEHFKWYEHVKPNGSISRFYNTGRNITVPATTRSGDRLFPLYLGNDRGIYIFDKDKRKLRGINSYGATRSIMNAINDFKKSTEGYAMMESFEGLIVPRITVKGESAKVPSKQKKK